MVNTLQPGSPPASDITVSQTLVSSVSGRAAPLVSLPPLPKNQISRAAPLCPLAATFAIDFSIVSGVVERAGLLVAIFRPLLSAMMHASCHPPGGAGGGSFAGFGGFFAFSTK